MPNERQHQCLLLGIDATQHKAVTVDCHSQRAVGMLMLKAVLWLCGVIDVHGPAQLAGALRLLFCNGV